MTARTHRLDVARCNIGPAELRRRRRSAVAATIVAALLAAILVAAGVPPVARLALWPFASAAGVTWLQVVRKFCVRFGALGVENFGAVGPTAPVDARTRAADRRQAIEMIVEGALIGLGVAFVLVLLPV